MKKGKKKEKSKKKAEHCHISPGEATRTPAWPRRNRVKAEKRQPAVEEKSGKKKKEKKKQKKTKTLNLLKQLHQRVDSLKEGLS
jgi:hypothetical protein